jgi:DNA-binding GntR family transcriptional regulator
MPIPSATAIRPRSLLRDDVYVRLRDAIVDGTLEPGEQLRDGELATWLGVSRTPVREALLRLQQAGLVVARPGRSTSVATLDTRAIRDAQAVVAGMHELAVRQAVPQLTVQDLDRMRAANDRFAAALRRGDVDAALAADDEFHAVPVTCAANQALRQVLEQFTPSLRRLERLRFSSLTGRGSVGLHERLIERCAAGDAIGAAAVAYETWQTLEPLLEGVDPGTET